MSKRKRKIEAKKWARFFKIQFVLWVGVFAFLNWDQQSKVEAKLISPMPDVVESKVITPTTTPTPKATWDTVAHTVIDEFKDEGKKVTIQALLISYCESKWEEDAYNWNNPTDTRKASEDKGVFQINSVHKQPESITYNFTENIKWAKNKMIRDKNWNAWSCKWIISQL